MAKHRKKRKQIEPPAHEQGLSLPWRIAGNIGLALCWVSPIALIWVLAHHWRVLLGPKSSAEVVRAVQIGLTLLGSGILVLVYELKIDANLRSGGIDKRERQRRKQIGRRLGNFRQFLLYSGFVIGLAAVSTFIPSKHEPWDRITFEPTKYYIAMPLLVLCALGMKFERSKNPVAKFLFGTPVPWLDKMIDRMDSLRGWR